MYWTLGKKVWNQSFNIATEPSLHTLKSIVNKMADFMNVTIDEIDTSDHNLYMYPTVYSGGIDTTKAKELLNFQPTLFQDALKTTISWFDNEFLSQYDYREEMISDIIARIVPKQRRDQFYLAIDRELTKAGVELNNYKAKRKGDLEFLHKFEKVAKQEL